MTHRMTLSRLSVVILVVAVAVALGLFSLTRELNQSDSRRLLALQASNARTTMTSLMSQFESPLASVGSVAAASDANPAALDELTTAIPSLNQFSTLTVLRSSAFGAMPVVEVRGCPSSPLGDLSKVGGQEMTGMLAKPGANLVGLFGHGRERHLALSVGAPTIPAGYVVYAELPLPTGTLLSTGLQGLQDALYARPNPRLAGALCQHQDAAAFRPKGDPADRSQRSRRHDTQTGCGGPPVRGDLEQLGPHHLDQPAPVDLGGGGHPGRDPGGDRRRVERPSKKVCLCPCGRPRAEERRARSGHDRASGSRADAGFASRTNYASLSVWRRSVSWPVGWPMISTTFSWSSRATPTSSPRNSLKIIRPRRTLARSAPPLSRAAELTRQLLVFSRRDLVQPSVLDVNVAIADVVSLLRRTLGEDVQLNTVLSSDMPRVLCDPGELQQVLMNLVVNARQAIGTDGTITIETCEQTLDDDAASVHAELNAGRYVRIAVTDTGCGMTPDTLSRVFEPYFTTKDPGSGTGLGLSTVYGIVSRYGGYVTVYSEVDVGTTFKVYLPSTDESASTGPGGDPCRHSDRSARHGPRRRG